jgi:hypothetical protein
MVFLAAIHDRLVTSIKRYSSNWDLRRKKLVVVPNATHLFEEPGTLEEVTMFVTEWFRCYFQIKNNTIVLIIALTVIIFAD